MPAIPNSSIFVLIAVAIVFLLSRGLTMRAMKHLSQEQKASLLLIMRRMSRIQVLVIMALFAGLIAAMQFTARLQGNIIVLIYFVLLVLLITSRALYIYFQLRRQGFPQAYLKSMIISMVLQSAAIIVFAFFLFRMVTFK